LLEAAKKVFEFNLNHELLIEESLAIKSTFFLFFKVRWYCFIKLKKKDYKTMTTFETYFKSNRNYLVCCSKENLSDIVRQAQIKKAEKR
jgi:hypothetical protein